MNSDSEQKYWFPAKKRGWGWGLPVTWQGWVVYAVYSAGMIAGAVAFPPENFFGTFLVHAIALTVLLVVVCLLKGEPPRWRWADSDNGKKK